MSEDVKRAKDFLDPNWLPQYELARDRLSDQLRELNMRLFMLEKIELFPFWLFISDTQDYIFWRTARIAFIETCLLIAWRVIVDPRSDVLSLKNFRDDILAHAKDEESRRVVEERYEKVDFEKRISGVDTKIHKIRHNHLAHLNKREQLDPKLSNTDITFGELQEILGASIELYNTLTFEIYYYPWLWDYHDEVRKAEQTDIERLLAEVARKSTLLNLPERNLEIWQRRRLSLTPDEMNLFNEYRRKAHLSEQS